jgi:hypothetical protein
MEGMRKPTKHFASTYNKKNSPTKKKNQKKVSPQSTFLFSFNFNMDNPKNPLEMRHVEVKRYVHHVDSDPPTHIYSLMQHHCTNKEKHDLYIKK